MLISRLRCGRRKQNEKSSHRTVLYALAAVIWLALGVMSWNVIYLGLSVVFFVMAIKKRKPKDDQTEK